MLLRKSRSSDALGKGRPALPDASPGEGGKNRPRLTSKRSMRLWRSPRLGSPPMPPPQISAPTPVSSSMGTFGLGINSATTEPPERPLPPARMYDSNEQRIPHDLFSTSRPRGTGMRLPPVRRDSGPSPWDVSDGPATVSAGTTSAAPSMSPAAATADTLRRSERSALSEPGSVHDMYLSDPALWEERGPAPAPVPPADKAALPATPAAPAQRDLHSVASLGDLRMAAAQAGTNSASLPPPMPAPSTQPPTRSSRQKLPPPPSEAIPLPMTEPSATRSSDAQVPVQQFEQLGVAHESVRVADRAPTGVDALIEPYDARIDASFGPEEADQRSLHPAPHIDPDQVPLPSLGAPVHGAVVDTLLDEQMQRLPNNNAPILEPPLPLRSEAPPLSKPASEAPKAPAARRLEWLVGPNVLVYDDPNVGAEPKAVAYTYDDWFLEPQVSDTGDDANASGSGDGDTVTAVVGWSPKDVGATDDVLSLYVFSSFVRRHPGSPCLLDMASRVEHETPEVAPKSGDQPMTVSQRHRLAQLFEGRRHVVLAASPRRVVAEMTSGSSPGLAEDVLLAYRQYFSPARLLHQLLQRFDWAVGRLNNVQAFGVAVRALSHTQRALCAWLQYFYELDFEPDAALTRQLVEWAAVRDRATQHWSYAADPASVGEHVDPRDLMHQLWHVVQETVPPELLPDGAVPATVSDGASSSPGTARGLTKKRSISRLLPRSPRHNSIPPDAPDRSPSSRRRTQLLRRPSVGASPGSPRTPPVLDVTESPRTRSRRQKSLMGMRRLFGPDAPAERTPSIRRYEPPPDGAAAGDEAALAQLERRLASEGGSSDDIVGEVPVAVGPPPSHARFSGVAPSPTLWSQRGTLLLAQRSETIARQLAMIECQLFARVRWMELTEPTWDQHTLRQDEWQREYQTYVAGRMKESSDGVPVAPGNEQATHLLISRFNRACAWVASHIVATSDLAERAAMVSKFIRIAWHSYLLGNMETLCQVLFGLQSPWVLRLRQTWARIEPWEKRMFTSLRQFTSPRSYFAHVRRAMHESLDARPSGARSVTPHVPFFGVFVADLATSDALASFVDATLMPNIMPFYDDQELSQSWDALVNLYRLRSKAAVVRDFIALQKAMSAAADEPIELPVLFEALQLNTLTAVQIQSASLAAES